METTHEIKGQPGRFKINNSCEDDMHEYGIYDNNGTEICTGYFCSTKRAEQRAKEQLKINNFTIKDLTEEEMNALAGKYICYIKKIRPSFKKSHIILDMSRLIYSRTQTLWCTVIPFTHNDINYVYHESASNEWIEKG